MDITAIDAEDGSFDAVLCLHVLEHVADDQAALRELRRVLRPGGWGVIQVPIMRATTDEDVTMVDPAERLRRFGQSDNVRVYGEGFFDRLRDAGFVVSRMRPATGLGRLRRWRYGLDDRDPQIDRLPAAWEVYRVDAR